MSNTICAKIVTTPTLVVVDSLTITRTKPFVAGEYPIEVAWQTSDLDSFTPASAPLLKAVEPTNTSQNSESTSSSLSTGTKASIAVGSIFGLLLLVALAILLARARKHHIKRTEGRSMAAPLGDSVMPAKVESDSRAIFEANEDCNPAEADFSHMRVELEGDWPGREVTASTITRSSMGAS